MKKILFLIVLTACFLSLNAQDIMVLKGGRVYHVKVLQVTPTEVKYINKNNSKGATVSSVTHSNLYYIRYQDGRLQIFNDSPEHVDEWSHYAEYMSERGISHEIDLYIRDAWGVGYQLRKGITSYLGWNCISISYMSSFTSNPKESGMINLRPIGFRFYTPIYEDVRLYTELNFGYSMAYVNQHITSIPSVGEIKISGTSHYYGFGFTAGFQISKHFAVGYNLEFYKNNNGESIDHWGKISLIL